MADPLDLTGLTGLDASIPSLIIVEATVVTGFESCVAEEVHEVLGVKGNITRGRVVFDLPSDRLKDVLGLRCVSTAYLLLQSNNHGIWALHVTAQYCSLSSQVRRNQNSALFMLKTIKAGCTPTW